MGKKFIESFVGECYRQGLSELQTWGVLNSAFEKRAEYTQPQLKRMKGDPRFEVTPITTDEVSFIEDPLGWLEYYKRLIANGWYDITGESDKIRTPVHVTDTTMTPDYLIPSGMDAIERAREDLIHAIRLKHRVHGEVKDNPAYKGMSVAEVAVHNDIKRCQWRQEDAAARRAAALQHIADTQSIYSRDHHRYKELEAQKQHIEALYKKEMAAINRDVRNIQIALNGDKEAIQTPYNYVLTDPDADRGATERARNAELREKGFLRAITDGNLFDYVIAEMNQEADEAADAKHRQQQRQLEEARRRALEAHDMIYGELTDEQKAKARAEAAKWNERTSTPAAADKPVAAPVTSTTSVPAETNAQPAAPVASKTGPAAPTTISPEEIEAAPTPEELPIEAEELETTNPVTFKPESTTPTTISPTEVEEVPTPEELPIEEEELEITNLPKI